MRSLSAGHESGGSQQLGSGSTDGQLDAGTLLTSCMKAHKGKWNLHLLREQAGDPELWQEGVLSSC